MPFTYPVESELSALKDLEDLVNQVIRYDPVGRGLASWAEGGDLLDAAVSLLSGSRVAVATGFYIPAAGVIETDGPPGAVVLADALVALGKTVVLVVEEHAAEILRSASDAAARMPSSIISLPAGDGDGSGAAGAPDAAGVPDRPPGLEDLGVSHIVAVERPGRTADGACYSMRGEDLSAYTADLDRLFLDPNRPFETIGIGDGGNELGLCVPAEKLAPFWPGSSPLGCRTPADYRIYAGVSNWGAYGLCAMLSAATRRFLLPSPDRIALIVSALVRAGAVDGISLSRSETVDGLPLSLEQQTVRRLAELVRGYGVNVDE